MRGTRISERLAIGIAWLLSVAHLMVAAALLAFGQQTGAAYPLVTWSTWEFLAIAAMAAIGVVLLTFRRRRQPGDSGEVLLIVALPALAAITLGAGFWATAILGAPFAPNLDAHTWYRIPTIIAAALGAIVGIRYRRRYFLALWFASLAALIVLNPFIWALLPRMNWWDARMLVLPLGVFVILHFSQGWPFALPRGVEWQVLVALTAAAWVLPPLIRVYRAGEAPAPAIGWLLVMGVLNWVLASLLVALPLYGWRFGYELDQEPGRSASYPWPGILLLLFAAATLTIGLLPDLLPPQGGVLHWLNERVVAPAGMWPALLEWAATVFAVARWLLLPYLAFVALEELSIWTYRRRQARNPGNPGPPAAAP